MAKGYRAKEQLELVHSDLCGPMTIQARGGFEYFITFIDDYSRYVYIYLMRRKFEAFEKFKEYREESVATPKPDLTLLVDPDRNPGTPGRSH